MHNVILITDQVYREKSKLIPTPMSQCVEHAQRSMEHHFVRR